MNAHQAIARLRKAINDIAYKENPKALDKDERAKQRELGKELTIQESNLKTQIDVLRLKLLDVPEYIDLMKKLSVVRKQRETAFSRAHQHRITVGTLTKDLGMFHVRVEGDNWEDVIAKAKEKGILK